MIDATSMHGKSNNGQRDDERDVRSTQATDQTENLDASQAHKPGDDQGENMIRAQWSTVSDQLRGEIGEAAFQSWIKPMIIRGIEDGAVHATVPTRFMRDWVLAHYAERIATLWQEETPEVGSLEVTVRNERTQNQLKDGIRRQTPAAETTRDAKSGREGLSAALDPRFVFDNFVVGKPNEFAYAAARRVAEAERVPFNPLFLYGGVGLGKTHLMHAVAWHIRQTTPDRTVVYLSAEKFMHRFVQAIRESTTMDFKDQFRSVDVLMIDDVQFIAGKESTQEEFFHTFNALVDQGRQIVISADKSPSDLVGMEERLISRLNCGLVADIHATTYELRLGILQSKAAQMRADIPPKVLEFLAHKITANVRELEGSLNRVVAHSQLIGRDISIEATQEVLHDLLRANDRRVTIEEIQKQVANHFNIRISDMHSARRARSVARPRQVAMYLAKQLTARSLPEIGRKFGGRDHTTVMHAVKKVEELKGSDSGFAEDIELLRRMLEG